MRKYFLYAIGEIVLVVIGILIALQINNWNTRLNDIRAEEYYLNQIVIELQEDYESLNQEWDGLENQLPILEELLGIVNDKNATMNEFNEKIKAYVSKTLYALHSNLILRHLMR